MNPWSRPGSTTYPVGLLTARLARFTGNCRSAATPLRGGVEANAGIPGGALNWETYLGWHYNHGAALVAINTGATGQELPALLEKSAFGQEALAAYRKFLAGDPLREKPVTDTPQLRVQRKMVAVQTGLGPGRRRAASGPDWPLCRGRAWAAPASRQAERGETVLEEALRRLATPPAAPGAATTGK